MLTTGENLKRLPFTVQKLCRHAKNGHFGPFLWKCTDFQLLKGNNFSTNRPSSMVDPSLERVQWVLNGEFKIGTQKLKIMLTSALFSDKNCKTEKMTSHDVMLLKFFETSQNDVSAQYTPDVKVSSW